MPAGILVDHPSFAGPAQQHLRSTHEATGINNDMRYCAKAIVFGDASMTPDEQLLAPTHLTLDRVKLAANLAAIAVRNRDCPIAGFSGFAVSAASASPPTSSSAMAVCQERAVNGLASSPVFGSPGAAAVTNSLSIVGSRKSVNTTECVPVPSSEHVAEIVGRQGSKIKALRSKTNTYIKTPVRGEEPVFVVTGRCEDVAAAKREILSSSEHFSQIRASRFGAGVFSGLVGTGFSVLSNQSASVGDGPKQITIQVRVPYQVVGLVVGPKGATIKRIQQDSSTYIVTPSREREPVFEVTGTPEGVEKARLDIERYIAIRTRTAETTDASELEVSVQLVPPPLVGSPTDDGPGDLRELLDSKTQFETILKTARVACDDTNMSSSHSGIYKMNSPVSLNLSSNDSINRYWANQVPLPESVGQSKLYHTNRNRIPLHNVHSAGVQLSTNASLSSPQANSIQYNTVSNVANDLDLPVCDILSSSSGSIDWTSKLQYLTSLLPMVDERSLGDGIGKMSLPGSDECAILGSLNSILASLLFSTDSSSATTLHDNSINSYQNQQLGSAPQRIRSCVEPSLLFPANQQESVRCVPQSNAIHDQLSLCQ